MANFKLNQTGEQIQADLNLLDSNSATQGQVLTANGTGGAIWQNASGGGGNSYFEAFTGYQAGIYLSGAGYNFSAFKLHNAITDSLVDVTNQAMSGNYDYVVFTNGQTLASGKITNIGNASDLDLLVITKDGSTILGKNESIDIPGLTTAPFLVKFIRTSSSQIEDVRVQFNLIAD